MSTRLLQPTFPAAAKKNHMDIVNFGSLEDQLIISPHTKSTGRYEIVWMRKGSGRLIVNLNENHLDPGLIYFVNPGQLRTLYLDDDASGFYLSISPDLFGAADNQLMFVSMLRQCRGLGNAMIMQLDCSREIEHLLNKMNDEANTSHHLQFEMLQVLFRTFLLHLSKINCYGFRVTAGSNDMRIVKNFIQLVNRHYVTKKMVSEYASELCVTRSYLNKVVKRISGLTASQIIQECIIQEAKRQAIRSGNSMKEIAYSLGFDDSAHFSKFFKTNCGINFTSYKRELAPSGL